MIALLALWAVLAAVGTWVLQRHLRKLDERRRRWNPGVVQVFLQIDVEPYIKAMNDAARALARFNRVAEKHAADLDRELRKVQEVLRDATEEQP